MQKFTMQQVFNNSGPQLAEILAVVAVGFRVLEGQGLALKRVAD